MKNENSKSKVGKRSKLDYIYLVLGFMAAILMSSEPEVVTTMATGGDNGSFIFLIMAGFIIAIALILPDIPGGINSIYSIAALFIGCYSIYFISRKFSV